MKFIKQVITVMLAIVVGACTMTAPARADQYSGTLVRNPELWNFDFLYLPIATRSYQHVINGGELVMQSRFVWYGSYGQQITEAQHAIAAFTQYSDPAREKNTSNQPFFTHGAGAFVGERGLQLELWFRTADNIQNAVTWNQDDNGCIKDVLGTIGPNVGCLPAVVGPDNYLTRAPDFVLRKGYAYWVRVKITQADPGNSWLYADLVEDGAQGLRVVQQGRVKFTTAAFFPVQGQNVSATVARTPGTANEPFINYIAFDVDF